MKNDYNIELLQDIPEMGRHWKKGMEVFHVTGELGYKLINEGKAIEITKDAPKITMKGDQMVIDTGDKEEE